MSKNNFRIKPVEAHKLLIPAMLLLSFAYFLKLFRTYVAVSILVFVFGGASVVHAQPNLQVPGMDQLQGEDGKPKEPEKSEETLKLEKKFARGELSDDGINYLATKLLEDGFPKDSSALYQENLKDDVNQDNIVHHFNHATAMLTEGEKKTDAIAKYKEIVDYIEKNPNQKNDEIEKIAKLNILKSFRQSKGGGGKKDKENDEKDKKNKSSNKDKSEGDGDPKNKDDKDQKDGDKDKDKEKKEKPKKDMRKKDDGDKKESAEEKAERKKKLPALLKQLMSDDNKLQKRMIDAKTTKRKSSEQKDW